jgi:hypothetical protein
MRLETAKRPRWILPIVAVLLASPLVGAASELRQPAFELAGLAKLEGDRSFALLKEPELTGGAPVLVRQGQSIGPYRLIAVEDDRVLLESPTGRVTVHLGSKGGSGAAAGSPPSKPAVGQAPSAPAAPTSDPFRALFEGRRSPDATVTAEESAAALTGTQDGTALDVLKNALAPGGKR